MHNDTPIKALTSKQLHLLPSAFGSIGKVVQRCFNGVDLGMLAVVVLTEDLGKIWIKFQHYVH